MSIAHAVVEGTLRPNGSLELTEKFRLPPGRVRVTVEVLDEPATTGNDWFEYLRKARDEREAAGVGFRTREEIDAELDAMRDERDRPAGGKGARERVSLRNLAEGPSEPEASATVASPMEGRGRR